MECSQNGQNLSNVVPATSQAVLQGVSKGRIRSRIDFASAFRCAWQDDCAKIHRRCRMLQDGEHEFAQLARKKKEKPLACPGHGALASRLLHCSLHLGGACLAGPANDQLLATTPQPPLPSRYSPTTTPQPPRPKHYAPIITLSPRTTPDPQPSSQSIPPQPNPPHSHVDTVATGQAQR
jgi:hypothetical protein